MEFQTQGMLENLPSVIDFVEDCLKKNGFSQKQINQTNIAVEEIFINISSYAYAPFTGEITLKFYMDDSSAAIAFIDTGVFFNPLKKTDPDLRPEMLQEKIGGLGIFMAKQLVSDMTYQYKNKCNIVTLFQKRNL